jgi:hypothetical protein
MNSIRTTFVDFLAGFGFVSAILIGWAGIQSIIQRFTGRPGDLLLIVGTLILGSGMVAVGKMVRET